MSERRDLNHIFAGCDNINHNERIAFRKNLIFATKRSTQHFNEQKHSSINAKHFKWNK